MRREQIYADTVVTSFDAPLIRDVCREYIARQHEAAKDKMRAAGLIPRPWDGIPSRFTIDLDILDEAEAAIVAQIADEELRAYAAGFGVELRPEPQIPDDVIRGIAAARAGT